MNIAKDEVKCLLDQLPDNCTFEDIQYHIYVVEKIQRGIERAEKEREFSQQEVENTFKKWTSK